MAGFYVFDPNNPPPGYEEREIEGGYKVAAQPGRTIEVTHPQWGKLQILAGCVSELIAALDWALGIQWEEEHPDA
jgi:hypothetical protein